MIRKLVFVLLIALMPVMAFGQTTETGKPVKTVTDADVVTNTFWSADTVYLMDGKLYVEDGEALTIEAGTVVKAEDGTGVNSTALIVARGGKIYAEGTAINPIIFTTKYDNVDDLTDMDLALDRGAWGGVIILGKATVNTTTGVRQIEGIVTSETRAEFGGGLTPDDHDNSGVFRYVSIRHGGEAIGTGNEINGLTMGGVGDGTVIEYIEVFNNDDDGFEWFGGTVNTKYLVSAFNEDDGFDWDNGFSGKGQFWLQLGSDDVAISGHAGEHDGGTDPKTGTPYSIPVIYNATYIGPGENNSSHKNDVALYFEDNSGGKYYNSIFYGFPKKAVRIQDNASGEDVLSRFQAGDLDLRNNIWYGFGGYDGTAASLVEGGIGSELFSESARMNMYTDPMLYGVGYTNDGTLFPVPQPGSPAYSAANVKTVPADNFYTGTDYIGAFKDLNWLKGWTYLDFLGYISTITDIEDGTADKVLPTDFALRQNYPNPFNPETTIQIGLPRAADVTLNIYNVMGQEVATLINGEARTAGVHSVVWNASDLASGMYFYRLVTGGKVMTRRMMLLK